MYSLSGQKMVYNFDECLVMNFSDIAYIKKLARMEYQTWRSKIRESSVSHELLTPLRCLIKLSQDLLKNRSQNPKQIYRIIFSQTKIIQAQINDILDNNMAKKREMVPNLQVVSLVEIVMETIQILQDNAVYQRVKIHYSGPCSKSVNAIKTDAVRVQQILINLLTNAIKFSSPESIVSVCLTQLDTGSFDFKVAVVDEGLGIRADDQKRLFKPYFESTD